MGYGKRQGIENQKKNQKKNHTNHCIVKNTARSPGSLRRLAVIQTPEKDSQVTLVRKIHKELNNNNHNNEYFLDCWQL